jgi:hypothetical protein
MHTITRSKRFRKTLWVAAIVAAMTFLIVEPAFAAGGLQIVNDTADKVLMAMRGVQVVIVVIAVWMLGIEIKQKKATVESVARIVIGAACFAGGTEIATYFVG